MLVHLRKTWIVCGTLSVVFLLIAGCGTSKPQSLGPSKQKVAAKQDRPATSEVTLERDPETPSEVDPANAIEVVIVPFEELAQVLRDDKNLRKFGSKQVQTTVVVSGFECGRGPGGKGTRDLLLCPAGQPLPARLLINPKTPQPWARVAMDQEVTLLSGPASLEEPYWEILDSGSNPAPILTAKDLVSQFQQEGILAVQKYDSRPAYVTGQVLKVKREGSFHTITLQGSDSMNIQAMCDTNPLTELIKPKQTVHLLGRVRQDTLGNSSTSPIVLYQALPITIPFPVAGIKYAESIDGQIQGLITSTRQSTPAAVLSADDYKSQDESTLLKKYAGKIVEVSGSVARFASYDKGDSISALLSDDGNPVHAILLEPEPWKNYVIGQQVIVRGRMNDGLANGLHNAVVVEAKPQPEPLKLFTTDDLIEAYSGDPDNFIARWTDRPMEVLGVLKSIDLSAGIFELSEDGAIPVVVKLPDAPAHRARFGKHKIGDRVQIMTVIDPFGSNFETLKLNDAWDRNIKSTSKEPN